MAWILSVLYIVGFSLPVLGIVSIFRDVRSGYERKSGYYRTRDEVAAEKENRLRGIKRDLAQTDDPDKLQKLRRDEDDIHDWETRQLRAQTTDFPTYASVQARVEDDHFGTGLPQLKNAKRDLILVGGGLLSATIASIWSLWL
jgi:hypothetical protein